MVMIYVLCPRSRAKISEPFCAIIINNGSEILALQSREITHTNKKVRNAKGNLHFGLLECMV